MIGVITYNVPHKKTQDVLFRLRAFGHKNVECVATQFIQRKKFVPLVSHRYAKPLNVEPAEFCRNLGYSYTENINLSLYDKIIIGGCGILSPETIRGYEIINSHPGYLPFVRGLDSLKWAIYEGYPIGVTTHVIDEDIDAGYMIDQRFIQVEFFDSLQNIGMRIYEMELDMLIEALDNPNRVKMDARRYPPHRRMPHRLEMEMLAKFEHMKI